jgi:hypothetical protein
VAERGQAAVVGECREPAEPTARDVLEEHALDRVAGAEVEDLVQTWLDRLVHRANRGTG